MCGYFCTGFIDFMFTNKTLTDYTNQFSPYDFDKNDQIILSYFKDATDQTKFRLCEIKNIENDFVNEINQQKTYSKKQVCYYF